MKKLLLIPALALTISNTAAAKQIMNGPAPNNSCAGYEVETVGGVWYLLPYSVANSPSGPFQLNTLITSEVAYSNRQLPVVINFDVTGTSCGVPTIANVRFGQ